MYCDLHKKLLKMLQYEIQFLQVAFERICVSFSKYSFQNDVNYFPNCKKRTGKICLSWSLDWVKDFGGTSFLDARSSYPIIKIQQSPLVIQSSFFSFIKTTVLPNFVTWIMFPSVRIVKSHFFGVTYWVLTHHITSKQQKKWNLDTYGFSSGECFLEAENVQCHLKPEHLLRSPMKLDKKNDEAAYRIPMKVIFVQHICTMFRWKQNITRDEFNFVKLNHKARHSRSTLWVQIQHLGKGKAKQAHPKKRFLFFFPGHISWE